VQALPAEWLTGQGGQILPPSNRAFLNIGKELTGAGRTRARAWARSGGPGSGFANPLGFLLKAVVSFSCH